MRRRLSRRLPGDRCANSGAAGGDGAAFDADGGAVDDVLFRLCADAPGHSGQRTIMAMIVLVGHAYSAGLERCVTPPTGEQAITVIAVYIAARGADIASSRVSVSGG